MTSIGYNQSVYVGRYAIAFLVIALSCLVVTFWIESSITQIVYLGPFLATIYACEHTNKKYGVIATSNLKQLPFYLSAVAGQILVFVAVAVTNDIGFENMVAVFVLQTIFSLSAVLVARQFQKIRDKRAK